MPVEVSELMKEISPNYESAELTLQILRNGPGSPV